MWNVAQPAVAPDLAELLHGYEDLWAARACAQLQVGATRRRKGRVAANCSLSLRSMPET